VMAEHCRNSAEEVRAADPTGGVGVNAGNFAFYAGQPVGEPLPARALFSVRVTFDPHADLRSPLALDTLREIATRALARRGRRNAPVGPHAYLTR
jgi:hypothetical protein